MNLPTPYYSEDGITIYHADCRDVLPHLEPVTVVMTDPPYSLSVAQDHSNLPGRGTRKLNFFAGDMDWAAMTDAVVERLAVMTALAPAHYVWCGHRQLGPIVETFEAAGFNTRFLVWRKKCPVPAPPGVGWDSAAELCVYAFRAGRKWTPPTGVKCPNVITADSYRHGQPGKVSHPTQKPTETATVPLRYSSEVGDTVLDPFMGSGTTLCVARGLSRKAIGIEIEERYCALAVDRLRQGSLDLDGAA